MKNFKISTIVAIAVYAMLAAVFPSCSGGVSKRENPKSGKAVLVAYRVSRHSHLWFQNPETKQIYDIDGLGGRREPNINLGDTIPVQYCKGEIVFDRYSYVRQPYNEKTRFIYLDGYGYLYRRLLSVAAFEHEIIKLK